MDRDSFHFSRGRWGMSQGDVMEHEISEFLHSDDGELYYRRELLGFPAFTKYCFDPEGRLWAGIYRIASPKREDRACAFDALRLSNVRLWKLPTWIVQTLPNGEHVDVDVRSASEERETDWLGEWGWRHSTGARVLKRFELNGRLEVWFQYVSESWIQAFRSGQLPEGPAYVIEAIPTITPMNRRLD